MSGQTGNPQHCESGSKSDGPQKPRDDHGAFFANRPLDEEVERPCVLGVERTTHDLVNSNVMFVGLASAMSRGALASVDSRADGSIALLGSLATTRPGPTFSRLWCYLDKGPTTLMFVLADGCGDSIDIETMGPTKSLAELVEILDD